MSEELMETVARALWDFDNPHYPAVFTKAQADELWAGSHGSPMHATYVGRAAAAIAALPPSPAEEAVKRRLELARIEGRAESLNAEVHEMEDDGDAQLLHVRAIQWEQEAAELRAALASPAPGCTCDRVDQPATYHFQGCPAVYPSAPHDKQGQRREDGLPDDWIDADWTYYA